MPPANRRKGRAVFPCRIRHRKPARPLLSWPFTFPVSRARPCHFLPLSSTLSTHPRSSHTAGAAQTVSLRRPRRCHANFRGLRLSRHQLMPPWRKAKDLLRWWYCPCEPPQGSRRFPVPNTAPKTGTPLALMAVHVPCLTSPPVPLPAFVFNFVNSPAIQSHGRSGTDCLVTASAQVSRQLSRTQVVTPPAYATQEKAVAIWFPSPTGGGGSENRLH